MTIKEQIEFGKQVLREHFISRGWEEMEFIGGSRWDVSFLNHKKHPFRRIYFQVIAQKNYSKANTEMDKKVGISAMDSLVFNSSEIETHEFAIAYMGDKESLKGTWSNDRMIKLVGMTKYMISADGKLTKLKV